MPTLTDDVRRAVERLIEHRDALAYGAEVTFPRCIWTKVADGWTVSGTGLRNRPLFTREALLDGSIERHHCRTEQKVSCLPTCLCGGRGRLLSSPYILMYGEVPESRGEPVAVDSATAPSSFQYAEFINEHFSEVRFAANLVWQKLSNDVWTAARTGLWTGAQLISPVECHLRARNDITCPTGCGCGGNERHFANPLVAHREQTLVISQRSLASLRINGTALRDVEELGRYILDHLPRGSRIGCRRDHSSDQVLLHVVLNRTARIHPHPIPQEGFSINFSPTAAYAGTIHSFAFTQEAPPSVAQAEPQQDGLTREELRQMILEAGLDGLDPNVLPLNRQKAEQDILFVRELLSAEPPASWLEQQRQNRTCRLVISFDGRMVCQALRHAAPGSTTWREVGNPDGHRWGEKIKHYLIPFVLRRLADRLGFLTYEQCDNFAIESSRQRGFLMREMCSIQGCSGRGAHDFEYQVNGGLKTIKAKCCENHKSAIKKCVVDGCNTHFIHYQSLYGMCHAHHKAVHCYQCGKRDESAGGLHEILWRKNKEGSSYAFIKKPYRIKVCTACKEAHYRHCGGCGASVLERYFLQETEQCFECVGGSEALRSCRRCDNAMLRQPETADILRQQYCLICYQHLPSCEKCNRAQSDYVAARLCSCHTQAAKLAKAKYQRFTSVEIECISKKRATTATKDLLKNKGIYFKTDGSLRPTNQYPNNMEVCVGPFIGDELKDAIYTACNKLVRTYKAAVNYSCGLHVHVNVQESEKPLLGNLLKWWVYYQDLLFKCVHVERTIGEVSRYCARNKGRETIDTGRYYALNLTSYCKHRTVEFRLHHGSVNAEEVFRWAQFCVAFVDTFINKTYVESGTVDRYRILLKKLVDDMRLNFGETKWLMRRMYQFRPQEARNLLAKSANAKRRALRLRERFVDEEVALSQKIGGKEKELNPLLDKLVANYTQRAVQTRAPLFEGIEAMDEQEAVEHSYIVSPTAF